MTANDALKSLVLTCLAHYTGNQRGMLGEILPLILFAILVGAAGLGLPQERRHRVPLRSLTPTGASTGT